MIFAELIQFEIQTALINEWLVRRTLALVQPIDRSSSLWNSGSCHTSFPTGSFCSGLHTVQTHAKRTFSLFIPIMFPLKRHKNSQSEHWLIFLQGIMLIKPRKKNVQQKPTDFAGFSKHTMILMPLFICYENSWDLSWSHNCQIWE